MIELFYLGLTAGLCVVVAPFIALALRGTAHERPEKPTERLLIAYLEVATLAAAILFSSALAAPYRYALGEVFGLDAIYGPIPIVEEPTPTRRCSPTSIACLPAAQQRAIISERRDLEHRVDLLRGGTFAAVALIVGAAHVGLRALFARGGPASDLDRIHVGTGLVVFGLVTSLFLVQGLTELTDRLFLPDPIALHPIGSQLPLGLGALTVWLLYVVVLIALLVRAHPDALQQILARLRPAQPQY